MRDSATNVPDAGNAAEPGSALAVPATKMTASSSNLLPSNFPPEASPPTAKGGRVTLAGARLRKHADYQRAYAASLKRQSASMSWFLAPRPAAAPDSQAGRNAQDETRQDGTGPRVGITAGKVLGKAHERNRIKRRMREALRQHVALLPSACDLILHPRRAVLTIEFGKLEAEIARILQQAKAEAERLKERQREAAEQRRDIGAMKPAL